MISATRDILLRDAEGFTKIADTLRARCFLGSLVNTDEFCPTLVSDLLELTIETVVETALEKRAVGAEEVDAHVVATYFVGQFGPGPEAMFGEEALEAAASEDPPEALCDDQQTPNPEFVSYIVSRLYKALEMKCQGQNVHPLAVSIVFAAEAAWLSDASNRGIFSIEETQAQVSRLREKLSFTKAEQVPGRARLH